MSLSKEDRRGVRMDLEGLREFVKTRMLDMGELTTKGSTAIKFGWAHAKLYSMFRQCAEVYDDIEIVRGSLCFTGVE